MSQVVVSVAASVMDALQLQRIIATPGYPVRVLACEQVAGDDRNPIYAYVTANEDGDYLVNKIKLTRTGLASNQYRTASKIMAVDGTYQTLYHALQIVDAQRTGKFRSLSGPPPLSSAMFSLNELDLAPSPLLDSVLADWMAVQDIAPLRYAVYNPQRNEIEVSFQDPSAHNDEEHQLRIKEAIGKQLRELFESKHSVADENEPSGRYTRRPINNRTHNMSIISINLGGDDVASESAAKKAHYKFARVAGHAELVLPSSARAGLTEIKTHLKRAKTDRSKALRLVASHASVLKQAEAASTPERKKALKVKAKTIKGQVSALNKTAKAALREANKAARTHKLSGLKLAINDAVLANAKKLAAAKIDQFGADGKRGVFKPKFTTDAKFEALGAGTVTKAAKKAPAKPYEGPTTPTGLSKMPSHAEALRRSRNRIAENKAAKDASSALDAALAGDSSKEVPKLRDMPLDSFSTKRIPGTKVSIAAHDHFPASKEVKNVVKSLVEKGGVAKGKFVIKGNSIEYKLGTASYRMNLNRKTGKWDSYANFGGNGGGTDLGGSASYARKKFENSVKNLQKHDKVDRTVATYAWR